MKLIAALSLLVMSSSSAFGADLMTCKFTEGGSINVTTDKQKTLNLIIEGADVTQLNPSNKRLSNIPAIVDYDVKASNGAKYVGALSTGKWKSDEAEKVDCSFRVYFQEKLAIPESMPTGQPLPLSAKYPGSLDCGGDEAVVQWHIASCVAGSDLVSLSNLTNLFSVEYDD